MYEIKKFDEIPGKATGCKGRPEKYPLSKLGIGECFDVLSKSQLNTVRACYYRRKSLGNIPSEMKIATRGLTVYRIA